MLLIIIRFYVCVQCLQVKEVFPAQLLRIHDSLPTSNIMLLSMLMLLRSRLTRKESSASKLLIHAYIEENDEEEEAERRRMANI